MATKNSKTQDVAVNTVNTLDFSQYADAQSAMAAMQEMMANFATTFGSEIAAKAIPASLAKESVNLHSAEEKVEIDRLTARNKEIDAEIERLTSGLREEKAANVVRLSALNVKTTATIARTRTVVGCPECGQGRHADNDKTRACTVYARYTPVRDAAKEAKTAVPTFADFLLKNNLISPAQL